MTTAAVTAGPPQAPEGTLPRALRHQLLALPQRHDPVVDPGDLPHAQGRVQPELRADRADHADLPADGPLLQPLVGLYTDRHPKPHSLAFGMGSTLCGLLLLSVAPNFATVLVAAALVARARRCSTPSPRASRAWPRAGSRGWRSRSSRWAATRAAPWGRCWRRPWSCRTGRAPSPGSGWRRWWPSRCCGRSAPGTRRGT
jgi:hypothetical protein